MLSSTTVLNIDFSRLTEEVLWVGRQSSPNQETEHRSDRPYAEKNPEIEGWLCLGHVIVNKGDTDVEEGSTADTVEDSSGEQEEENQIAVEWHL